MAGAQFKVVFDGQMVKDADPDQVKANLARLFKVDADKVTHLFAGGRKLIRRDVDEATAKKFQIAFTRAGAIAVIVDPNGKDILPDPPSAPAQSAAVQSVPESPPSAATPSPLTQAASDSEPETHTGDIDASQLTRAELAEAGRAPPPLATRGRPSVPEHMTMADAGAVLVEASAVADAPNIDTSHLSMADAGEDLIEPKRVSAAQFDLSAYELAPADATMRGDT